MTSKIENKGYTGQSLHFLIVNNNNFNGSIPSTLNLVPTLEALRLDRNKLTGDLSNNSFGALDVPSWFSTLPSLTTLLLKKHMFKARYQHNYIVFHHYRLRKSWSSSNVHLSNKYSLALTNYKEYKRLKNNSLSMQVLVFFECSFI
ncbi:receptor-like protein 30 [Dioscorea cayenensis subsp. rotundata]|uniref:Receptor-like protein 30 n=1 Tax=Dioscorea cayennensis subsp. rotundata TaxID=55577 RepID=A0AB40ASK3_DIOCR|nr:receptor-like protein 30 [Dioscorea cayenensis subsp. rotundata]